MRVGKLDGHNQSEIVCKHWPTDSVRCAFSVLILDVARAIEVTTTLVHVEKFIGGVSMVKNGMERDNGKRKKDSIWKKGKRLRQ